MEENLCEYPVGKIALILPLPDGVTHVTAEAATKILKLNARLNALLFSTSLEASIEIRHLRQELEFHTKFKHDIIRKGKTKIITPKEHEEDKEEEEDDEVEEEQEEEDEKKKRKQKKKMKRRMMTKLGSKRKRLGIRMRMRLQLRVIRMQNNTPQTKNTQSLLHCIIVMQLHVCNAYADRL
ncbi:hypothetical protein L3X38_033696 [Prunus dulcis]|uniref:Uncharacterized protein n=1 Tax=Prunus dulcis TaxID=3755 RepID=A0AAD4YXV4_PRUDU|nr:hypothetical protein L3X38_033696 [Prunus dulcis]